MINMVVMKSFDYGCLEVYENHGRQSICSIAYTVIIFVLFRRVL